MAHRQKSRVGDTGDIVAFLSEASITTGRPGSSEQQHYPGPSIFLRPFSVVILTVLPDEAAIAACMAYVDLNPVRAGLAKSPEQSEFTSAQERIQDLRSAEEVSTDDAKNVRIEHGAKAGWLAPVELEPKRKIVRANCSTREHPTKVVTLCRCPNIWNFWTGRHMKPGKRGAIPKNAPPILDRLNLSAELWLHSFEHLGKRRAENHVTPASKINATSSLAAQPMAVQKARKKDGRESRRKLWITYHFWMAPFAFAVSRDCCADG